MNIKRTFTVAVLPFGRIRLIPKFMNKIGIFAQIYAGGIGLNRVKFGRYSSKNARFAPQVFR
jgi:hypothetical protein